jgi:hypothetical protein
MSDKFFHQHSFNFAPKEPGGESLCLFTHFYDNGDRTPVGIYTNQKIVLNSYSSSASINLCGFQITPDVLRKLADELEEARETAANKVTQTV